MKALWILGLGIVLGFSSCNSSTAKPKMLPKAMVDSSKAKSLARDTLSPPEKTKVVVSGYAKPVFGYRFIVTGDFDGSGKVDTLTEHFISTIDGKETNKFYEGLANYEQLVSLTVKKLPASFVVSSNKRIDTLFISSDPQLLGLASLRNEGDLDGDGGDEISYVVNWAAWSSVNTCYLMSYKNHKWKELYHFGMRDWQLPPLPMFSKSFGFLGVDEMASNTGDIAANLKLQQGLDAWPGFIKKIGTHKLRVAFTNEEANEDTAIVDLRHLKKGA